MGLTLPWGSMRPARRHLHIVLEQAVGKYDLDDLRYGFHASPVALKLARERDPADRLRSGLHHALQAGAQPVSWVSLACELQRDWARQETVQPLVEIVLTDRLLKE